MLCKLLWGASMEVNYNEIGYRLSARRRELNITQEVLRNLTDISINQISNIENNHCIPTIETILKLCKALNVTPDYFLLGILKDVNSEFSEAISEKALLCTNQQQKLIYDFISLLINENY